MHVLLTRPRIDAEPLAARLHDLGHTTIIEPLLDVVFHDVALNLQGAQALLFTSANGARATARATQERDILVLAVGPMTAAEATKLGFKNVSQSAGDGANALADHVRATLKPTDGTLIHPTGTVTAGDLKASLAPFCYDVRTQTIYEAHAAESLSGALTAELTAGLVNAAMFFSARTAGLFATLATTAALAPACRNVTALALSTPVAKALDPLVFQRVLIARQASAAAMLDLIGVA